VKSYKKAQNTATHPGTPTLTELFGYPSLTSEAKETAGNILIAVANQDADDLQVKLTSVKCGTAKQVT
jgi:hypothetical protein